MGDTSRLWADVTMQSDAGFTARHRGLNAIHQQTRERGIHVMNYVCAQKDKLLFVEHNPERKL